MNTATEFTMHLQTILAEGDIQKEQMYCIQRGISDGICVDHVGAIFADDYSQKLVITTIAGEEFEISVRKKDL